jgi:xanthine dehydrogenase large subunit
MLHAVVVQSPLAHARVRHRDASAALAQAGVVAVVFAEHIPGTNRVGPIFQDEPVLAEGEVHHVGMPVALVVAEEREQAEHAARLVQVDYEPLPAILSIEAALEAQSFLTSPHVIARGDLSEGFSRAAVIVSGETETPGQDHFYLETQCARAWELEGGHWHVVSSTQHPNEVQRMVARVLGLSANQVVCEVPRLGGGFGGKESQAANIACLAALGARVAGRPVSLWLRRHEDMAITGKRHPFLGAWRAGFAADGELLALEVSLWSDGGCSQDLSVAIMDRALFHLDNACYIPNLRFQGQVCRTHLPSNTAFRGFGGPQGMVMVEAAIAAGAEQLGMDPAELRRRNYYRPGRDRTPYGQLVPAPRLDRIHEELDRRCDYSGRRRAIEAENLRRATSRGPERWLRRGIALQPIKFGISFTNAPLNQAGSLVMIYADGSVQINHGGTEMGQGLHSKMLAVASAELGLPQTRLRLMNTSTDKVPNTSATAASSGADLNGQAVAEACRQLRGRMAAAMSPRLGCAPEELRFEQGELRAPSGQCLSFAEASLQCWLQQVNLSAVGFYRTPGIAYDRPAGQGTPFYYFAYGAAVIEVEVNGLTGEHRIRQVDVLHDVGDSLSPAIDVGQVEGALVQGLGWLSNEAVLYDARGRCLTRGPSTYKIPAAGDLPRAWRVELLEDAAQEGTIHGSKAVGEPPLMLAIGLIGALRQAIGAFGPGPVKLRLPATPEHTLLAIEAQRGG